MNELLKHIAHIKDIYKYYINNCLDNHKKLKDMEIIINYEGGETCMILHNAICIKCRELADNKVYIYCKSRE